MRSITHRTSAAALAAAGLLLLGAAAAPAAPAAHDVSTSASASASARHGYPTEQEIRGLFQLWNDALATGDPEAVADRYAPGAVLVPTLSNDIRDDRAGIVDYFTDFLMKQPSGEITESHVEILGRNAALDTGSYRFHLVDEQGEPYAVDARYTFVYERDPATGEWLIVNHHSSKMPEG